MNGWYQVTLNGDQVMLQKLTALEAEFDALFMAAGYPADMALFATQREDGGVEFYFSPEASHYAGEVIRQFNGHHCAPPEPRAVDLVEGERNVKQRLFV